MSNAKKLFCRLMQESDVVSAAAVYSAAFKHTNHVEDLVRKWLGHNNRGAMVALEGDTVVGLIYFAFIKEDGRDVLYIDRIAVCSENRRRGIAIAMLGWLKEYSAPFKHDFAFLLVNGGNKAAFDCYKRCGFEVSDSRIDKEPDYDPLLIRMERLNDERPRNVLAGDIHG